MTTYKDMTAAELAAYLRRYRAYSVIAVARLVDRWGTTRGKVNLGLAATGRNMRNNWLARPVETATKMGLLHEKRDGAAYCYTLTERGSEVLAKL